MTTVNDWVEEVRETLGPGVVDQVNRLAQDYEPGDFEIVLERDVKNVVPNQVMTCGLNAFMAWTIDPITRTIQVEPRWAGAPDVVVPAGTIVRVKPNVYTHRIVKALNDTITELSSPMTGLFAVATQDVPYQVGTVYDLSDCEQIDRVLRVQWGDPNDDMSEWRDLNAGEWQHRQMEPTSDFPSGHQLRIFAFETDPIRPTDVDAWVGETLRIIYGRHFSPLDSLTQDVSMTFLPETAWDIPPLGAAAKLSASSEYRRNLTNAQPDSRRANEVQPYSLLNAHKAFLSQYERRVDQEVARLYSAYSPKMR